MNDSKKEALARQEKAVEKVIVYQDFFNSEKGQEILYDLCKRFYYFSPTYTGSVNDCIYREGSRNVINFIMSQQQQDPAKILKILREKHDQELQYGK